MKYTGKSFQKRKRKIYIYRQLCSYAFFLSLQLETRFVYASRIVSSESVYLKLTFDFFFFLLLPLVSDKQISFVYVSVTKHLVQMNLESVHKKESRGPNLFSTNISMRFKSFQEKEKRFNSFQVLNFFFKIYILYLIYHKICVLNMFDIINIKFPQKYIKVS